MPGGEIPLTFDTRLPWPLEREPVTVGVPFPPAALGEAGDACLFDGDDELYCQREALATWPDGSVRWLLLDFQVDLPASRPKALLLVYGQGATQAVFDETGISLSEDRRETTIDTGPLRLVWQTRPLRPFATVHLDGAELLGAKEAADLHIVDLTGTTCRLSNCKLPSVTVEAGGPLRTAIRVQGSHVDEAGRAWLDFDLLLTAWSGKPWVALDYQIIHRGGEEAIELHEAGLAFGLAPRGPLRLTAGTDERLGGGPGAIVRHGEQALSLDIPREPDFGAPARPGALLATPWLDRSEEGRGIAVGIRHGITQFPKRLSTTPERLDASLYPPEDTPLRLHQGMAKSHELLLYFHDGRAAAEALGRRFRLFGSPLRPRLPSSWYQEAGAFGGRFPSRALLPLDVALDEALDRRPRAMGILHFGDEPHPILSPAPPGPVTWSNNACDLAYAYLLHYARSGLPRHLAEGEAIVRHVVDVDHVHFSTDPLRDGGLAAPSADHCADGRVTPAHQWVEGLLACHHLTGCRAALLAARRIGENVLRHVPVLTDAAPAETDLEALGWALYTLATLHHELGHTQCLEAARRLLDHLARCAARTTLSCSCAARCGHEQSCAIAVVLTAMARYHQATKEQRAADLFKRELDALLGGDGAALWRHTCLPRPWPDLQADALLLEPLAYACTLTGDARYLDTGQPLVRHLLSGGLRLAPGPAADLRQVGDAVLCRPVLTPPSGLAIARIVRPLLAYLAAAEAAGLLTDLGLD